MLFEHRDGKKTATALECRCGGKEQGIPLTENDLVFVTNGSCTEGTIYGDQDHAPNGDAEVRTSGCWSLWKNIARQDPALAIPRNSAPTSPRPTGSRPPSPPWTAASCPTSRPSASGTPARAVWSPAASSAARTPAGCSAGPSTARASSKSRTPARSASGSTACSPTCRGLHPKAHEGLHRL